MIETIRKRFFVICWLPLAIYLVADFYIATFEGWGLWAMGVVVLPALLLSVGFMGLGIWITVDSLNQKTNWIKPLVATVVSGSVFMWFVVRSLAVALLS